jgi:hypothetical protein
MNIVILLVILILFISFIRNIKEDFFIYPNFVWIPTRSTRLMSYDLRGDPHRYYVYPSYYSSQVPLPVYLYGQTRYDINGRYLIPRSKNINKMDAKKVQG